MSRTIEQARANLEASIPMIPTRYSQGIATADWATNAGSDAAETLWGQAVAKAAAEKRRQRGIQRVGNEVWRRAAMSKGAQNIGPGITAGLAKYAANFGPVLQAINAAAASLPPRTTDAVANVNNRVLPIVKAAVAAKVR